MTISSFPRVASVRVLGGKAGRRRQGKNVQKSGANQVRPTKNEGYEKLFESVRGLTAEKERRARKIGEE